MDTTTGTDDAGRPTRWRVPRLWRLLLQLARAVVFPVARLRVTGDIPADLRDGPIILAVNHVSPFDPVVMTAACGARRIAPRFMATAGVFRAPVVGWMMRTAGHIRVDRRTAAVADALPAAGAALAACSTVLVYPEGRIGLDPQMWPERGKTGAARMALASGAPVIPVAQWGAHEVVPYTAPRGALGGLLRALRHRPVVQVHFGHPVDLSAVDPAAPGAAVHATELIMSGIAAALAPLRAAEPELPRHIDRTRPVDVTRARGNR